MAAPRDDIPLTSNERKLLAWVKRYLGRTGHERRVAAIASRMFDLTASRHRLGEDYRTLLRQAAIVHDVGRHWNDADHPQEGAFLLLADGSAPLSPTQRRHLAYLTRYHRGRVPAADARTVLRHDDPVRELRIVLALLRAADALDKRRSKKHGRPTLRLRLRGSTLRIDCQATKQTTRALDKSSKFALLRQTTGCDVRLRRVA